MTFSPLLFLRSLLFAMGFYAATTLHVLAGLILTPFGDRPLFFIIRSWSASHRALCRLLLGQKVRIEGVLPDGQYFFVFKHESMFETIDLPLLLHRPIIVAKQELLDIPGWGTIAARFGMIGLKRATGAAALRHLQRQTKAALATGRPICLFPEGTRVAHGSQPSIKAGFAAMYQLVGLPVVPVAIDSGLLSPRQSFLKRPGTITYRVGEIIPPGLPRAEAEALAHAAINALNPPETAQDHPPAGDGHSSPA